MALQMPPNLQFLVDLVTFNEEILNGKLHFLGSIFANMEKITQPDFQNVHMVFFKISLRETKSRTDIDISHAERG